MESPPSKLKENSLVLSKVILVFIFTQLLFVGFVIVITYRGERISFNLQEMWELGLLFLLFTIMNLVYFNYKVRNDS